MCQHFVFTEGGFIFDRAWERDRRLQVSAVTRLNRFNSPRFRTWRIAKVTG